MVLRRVFVGEQVAARITLRKKPRAYARSFFLAKLPEVHRREVRQQHVAGSGCEAIVGAEKSRPSAAGEFARKSLAENSRLKILVAGEFGRIIIRRRMRAFYIVSPENHHRGSSVFKSLL